MKQLAAVILASLAAAGCASTADDDYRDDPVTVPRPATDPKLVQSVTELQTQLTELLERLDVMNQRLARVEESGAAAAPAAEPAAVTPRTAPPATAAAAPPQRPAEQPQRALVGARLAEDYRQAIILYGRGRHADARRAFQEVYEADQSGDLADNALFWIGETYFAAGDYTNALRHYARVVNEYSDQNKAPDALFKSALVQERTGDLALARRTLQQVIERYPYSSTASSAKAELQRIKY